MGIYKLIDEGIMKQVEAKGHRDYLGASLLGEECSRKLWYTFHQPKTVDDPRVHRIFALGHILEDYMIKLLRDAGLTVYCEDENGEQFGFRDGLIAGHIDGVVVGLPESSKPHLAEFKTANSKRFKQFCEKGCEAVEPKYWGQCHIYMYKMQLENCLFMVICKDTQQLYFERIKLDAKYAQSLLERGKMIAESEDMPARRYTKRTFFKCRFCQWAESCWEGC